MQDRGASSLVSGKGLLPGCFPCVLTWQKGQGPILGLFYRGTNLTPPSS